MGENLNVSVLFQLQVNFAKKTLGQVGNARISTCISKYKEQ